MISQVPVVVRKETLPTVDDSNRERRTVHLLLGQLHVQELHILRKIWILVGILYHCTLQDEDRGGYEAIERFM